MLCGANRYYALDVVPFASLEGNLKVFDDLVELFRTRAPTRAEGFPDFRQYLDDTLFPGHILTEELLAASLTDERIRAIRQALQNPGTEVDGICIDYMVPWSDEAVVREGSVDLVLSHSVLEHVVDLETAYRAIRRWLGPGGLMSHQIDLTAHGLSPQWNGYRAFPEIIWKAMMGRRDFLINRAPYSVHRNLVTQNGFEVLCDLQSYRPGGIKRDQLSAYWRDITDDDLNCSGTFIQARA
jgi:SAM-dependent methyltransferase